MLKSVDLRTQTKKLIAEEKARRKKCKVKFSPVIQEVRGDAGCHNDPRLLRSARSYARLVRQTMETGLTALTLRPACVLGVFFVKKKENRLRLIVDSHIESAMFAPCRLWSCCLQTDCRVLKSIPLVFPTENLLTKTTGVLMLPPVFTGCASLARFANLLLARVSNTYLKMTEIEGLKVSPNQTLWPMCCSLPIGFSWSLSPQTEHD